MGSELLLCSEPPPPEANNEEPVLSKENWENVDSSTWGKKKSS